MIIIINLTKIQNENRLRLATLLNKIPNKDHPRGWKKVTTLAVGGLTEIGFSKVTNQLLIISTSGRSLINCINGERLARDYDEDGDWYDPINLTCQGIGPIADENILIAGLHGGGLLKCNQYGESLELTSLQWPVDDIYFCPIGKSIFTEHLQTDCCRIFSDYVRCYGFSWHGRFIVIATSSDETIWQRLE